MLTTDKLAKWLPQELCDPSSYPDIDADSVETIETHISRVYLVGDFAFKIKKPIRTSFLDYSTLALREKACRDELKLDQRYAKDLYLDVVPIVINQGRVHVDGDGEAIEYAVRMRRFSDHALLSRRVHTNNVTPENVNQLAHTIAEFHHAASRPNANERYGLPDRVLEDAIENLDTIEPCVTGELPRTVHVLKAWTNEYHAEHLEDFKSRYRNGFIRQCHGDLHLSNIVLWRDKLVPFDGIEFNDRYRCIDTLSDAAFTAMDFAAQGRLDLSRSFVNAYLDAVGDHASLCVLRWYLVYRALVRAKVATIRIAQASSGEAKQLQKTLSDHLDLAYRFSLHERPAIWITHGVSGSGKSTASEQIVQRQGAIRLRSDVERKRYMGMEPGDHPTDKQSDKLYSEFTNHATYLRLQQLAKRVLHAGYPVVIDATFLKHQDRESFRLLAEQYCATFHILHCSADHETLRQRVRDRFNANNDVSDANLEVLEKQLANYKSLLSSETQYVVDANSDHFADLH